MTRGTTACRTCFAAPVAVPPRLPTRLASRPVSAPLAPGTSTPARRRARLPPTSLAARAAKAAALEAALRASVEAVRAACGGVGLHRYRATAPDAYAAAVAAVGALEASAAGFGSAAPRLRAQLPGTWTLVLTDSGAVEKNGGSVTGLGSLPGARCVRVDVELRADGKARTIEAIKVFGGLMEGENALIGKWRLAGSGGRTLEVTYASALLMGKATVRADSKAVLDTSYCSDQVRIGRSKGGDFYLFFKS